MNTIIFASHNKHKSSEIASLLSNWVVVKDLNSIGFTSEIPETGDTFHENAFIKAKTVFDSTGLPCLSDDSGLQVNFLNGQPGVKSARFAGPNANDLENVDLLLKQMENATNRQARFITILCLYDGANPVYFEGIVNGEIATHPSGSNGFGYDPVFIPDGYNQTFAELSAEQKNKISHRFNAVKKLIRYLDSAE